MSDVDEDYEPCLGRTYTKFYRLEDEVDDTEDLDWMGLSSEGKQDWIEREARANEVQERSIRQVLDNRFKTTILNYRVCFKSPTAPHSSTSSHYSSQ
jgi:hypothetical protein